MEIYSFSMDIKAGINRRPSVIEFNALDNSGQTGYQLAGLGDIFDDKIIPDLHCAMPDRKIVCINGKDSYTPLYEDKENGKSVFIKRDFYADRNSILFMNDRRQYGQITVNASLHSHSIYTNKAAAAYILQNRTDIINDHVPSFLCPTEYNRDLAARAISQIGKYERYVIKPVAELGGNGVRVVNARHLDSAIKEITTSLRQMDRVKFATNYWLSDKEPLFLIQPYIPSDPVFKDGKPYDGTMRVFATLYRETVDQPFTAIMHDAYWKLPLRSGGDISYSPSCFERTGVLKSVFNFFVDSQLRRINSLAVDDDLKNHVFACLEQSLPQMGSALFDISHEHLVKKHLFSNDPIEQGLGLMLATHEQYYLSDYPTAGRYKYPICSMSENIPPRIRKLYQKGAPHIAKSIYAKATEWQQTAQKSFFHQSHPVWIESYEDICRLPKREYPKTRFSFIGKMLALDT